jgi:hypothetical protein
MCCGPQPLRKHLAPEDPRPRRALVLRAKEEALHGLKLQKRK